MMKAHEEDNDQEKTEIENHTPEVNGVVEEHHESSKTKKVKLTIDEVFGQV